MEVVNTGKGMVLKHGKTSYNAEIVAKMSKRAFSKVFPKAPKQVHDLCKKAVNLIK